MSAFFVETAESEGLDDEESRTPNAPLERGVLGCRRGLGLDRGYGTFTFTIAYEALRVI